MIDGVKIMPLRQIVDERDKTMHMLKACDDGSIAYPLEMDRLNPFTDETPHDWGMRHG